MITMETRNSSYMDVLSNIGYRQEQCYNALKKIGEGTSNEIADVMLRKNQIPYINMNFTNPRINELRKMGMVKIAGKKIDPHTGKKCATYSLTTEAEYAQFVEEQHQNRMAIFDSTTVDDALSAIEKFYGKTLTKVEKDVFNIALNLSPKIDFVD